MQKRLKIYPVTFAIAAVAVGAQGAAVQQVLNITDGDFECDTLSVSAWDANGVLVPAPNVTLKLVQGGNNYFAAEVNLAGLMRGDQFRLPLNAPLKIKARDQFRLTATPQPGSTATSVMLNFIGTESVP